MSDYQVKYYQNSRSGEMPVLRYILEADKKDRAKIYKYINYLENQGGYLDEPYSRHLIDKIRELRVDFSHNRHRIFYFASINKVIILLHAFLKKTDKTPKQEIQRALENYDDVINNLQLYE